MGYFFQTVVKFVCSNETHVKEIIDVSIACQGIQKEKKKKKTLEAIIIGL